MKYPTLEKNQENRLFDLFAIIRIQKSNINDNIRHVAELQQKVEYSNIDIDVFFKERIQLQNLRVNDNVDSKYRHD